MVQLVLQASSPRTHGTVPRGGMSHLATPKPRGFVQVTSALESDKTVRTKMAAGETPGGLDDGGSTV